MRSPFEIEITKEDAVVGKYEDHLMCPIARVLRRACKTKRIVVGETRVMINYVTYSMYPVVDESMIKQVALTGNPLKLRFEWKKH